MAAMLIVALLLLTGEGGGGALINKSLTVYNVYYTKAASLARAHMPIMSTIDTSWGYKDTRHSYSHCTTDSCLHITPSHLLVCLCASVTTSLRSQAFPYYKNVLYTFRKKFKKRRKHW